MLMIIWCSRSSQIVYVVVVLMLVGLVSPAFLVSTRVLEVVASVRLVNVIDAQVVASVREGLGEEHRGRWKNLASNQAEAFLSAESQLIKFVSIEEALIMIITIISINLADNQAEAFLSAESQLIKFDLLIKT